MEKRTERSGRPIREKVTWYGYKEGKKVIVKRFLSEKSMMVDKESTKYFVMPFGADCREEAYKHVIVQLNS